LIGKIFVLVFVIYQNSFTDSTTDSGSQTCQHNLYRRHFVKFALVVICKNGVKLQLYKYPKNAYTHSVNEIETF